MSALLRSGKFLRLVTTGLTRQPGNQVQNAQPQAACWPQQGAAAGEKGGGGGAGGGSGGGGAVPVFDLTSPFQAWSLQHLESTLPFVGVQHDEDRNQDEIVIQLDKEEEHISHNVNKQEVEELLNKIPELSSPVATSQSVLVLRLCSKSVLQAELQTPEDRVEFVHSVWTRLEDTDSVKLSVDHYNALLAVYLENEHKFCPEHFQSRLRKNGVKANAETYDALVRRCCLDGNMEGANRILKCMRDDGYPLTNSLLDSLLTGHSNIGDVKAAKALLQAVKDQKQITVSDRHYIALAKCLAQKGEIQEVKIILQEKVKKPSPSIYYELVETFAQAGHRESAQEMISHTRSVFPEQTEGIKNAALMCISSLVNRGEDETAFNLIKYSFKTDKELVTHFLNQLVAAEKPVTKLLWFAEEMRRVGIISNGLETLLTAALEQKNFSLSLKLTEICIQDKQTNVNKMALPERLLSMSKSSLDVLSSVRAVQSVLSEEEIQKVVIPKVSQDGNSISELIQNLRKTGLPDKKIIPSVVDHLLEQDRVNEAKELAMEHSKLITKESQKFLLQSNNQMQMQTIPLTQIYDPQTQTFQYLPLVNVCQMFRLQGRFWDLEQLLVSSEGSYTPQDRKIIFMYTLQSYADQGLYDKAWMLARQLESEGLTNDFDAFHDLMASFGSTVFTIEDDSMRKTSSPEDMSVESGWTNPQWVNQNWTQSWTRPSSIASDWTSQHQEVESNWTSRRASVVSSNNNATSHHQKVLKKALLEKNVDQAWHAYLNMGRANKALNVTDSSSLIELLVNNNQTREAAHVTEDMLKRDTYPLPKIFRFLLNKMATNADVDAMERIGQHLSPKVKKEVSFDNRLCNAYLSAGRGSDYLAMLEKELAFVSPENLQILKDKFPRGGAMGLLENYPELLTSYSKLAHRFIELGYIAPMNVLWTYYFINGRHNEAEPLWHKHIKTCSQIMFQKICQTARSQSNADMAQRLVDLLQGANVTDGAQGIAYSCLLDVLTQHGQFEEALKRLRVGVEERGLSVDNVNRTALMRLKTGLENIGLDFEYEIPKKTKVNSDSRCLTPVDD